ncbi:MAG: ferrochelatase, partial [Alphaproteobacteria bacterium]|nr:ferrochelatase [Alphaproteobacteria bacterium]
MQRLAVVLFNLGGPDSPAAVRPFLFNLFRDPAIIGLPNPLRWLVARMISGRRAPVAREIYAKIGGKSPLLEHTRQQSSALQQLLRDDCGNAVEVFVAMRYWHPFAAETARAVQRFAPDRVVLVPLYPQYSTTTTGSSIDDWHRAAAEVGLTTPTSAVCCYPTEVGFIAAHARRVGQAWRDATMGGAKARILFSAHGLPRKVVARGDPYQWQIEQSAAAVVEALAPVEVDWVVCYQSRVGPLEWIGPYTDAEITRAGRDGVPVIVVPIAFVSEHSETLVELDVEYRRLAEAQGVPSYVRVPTVGTSPSFIRGLADLV